MTFDADVLIHSVNESSEFHTACAQRVGDARNGLLTAYLTWNVCYEFLRVSTHPNILSPPLDSQVALQFIKELLNSPTFRILRPTERHAEVLQQTLTEFPWIRSNCFLDVHTVVLMRENNVRQICTKDRGFRAFPFLTVIDPSGVTGN